MDKVDNDRIRVEWTLSRASVHRKLVLVMKAEIELVVVENFSAKPRSLML